MLSDNGMNMKYGLKRDPIKFTSLHNQDVYLHKNPKV